MQTRAKSPKIILGIQESRYSMPKKKNQDNIQQTTVKITFLDTENETNKKVE